MSIHLGNPDRAVIDRNATGLHDLLSNSISHEIFRDWIGDSTERESFLANTIWATIRWNKELGRSAGPTLASGFDVQHFYWFETFVVGPDGGILEHHGWVHVDDLSIWDFPDEGDEYRVGVMCRFVASSFPLYNKVTVEFAPNQRWFSPKGVRLAPRVVRPPEQVVQYDDGHVITLQDFEVGWFL